MDNREAIKIIRAELNGQLHYQHIVKIRDYSDPREYKRRLAHLHAVKALNNELQWIPITTRPMTEEEEKDACERWGVDYLEDYEKLVFTCQLPEDGQRILISTRWGVSLDTCDIDPDYGCGLEDNGDWDGVLAWMPLPEPYKEGDEE